MIGGPPADILRRSVVDPISRSSCVLSVDIAMLLISIATEFPFLESSNSLCFCVICIRTNRPFLNIDTGNLALY